MSFTFKNIHNSEHPKLGSNIRGEFGEALARALFVKMGFRVCDVQGDWYPYDMSIERHGSMYRVQVKTSTSIPNQKPYPKSEFSKCKDFDLAVIITMDGSVFLIPKEEMTFKSRENCDRFVLYPKYSKFKIAQFNGFSMMNPQLEVLNSFQGTSDEGRGIL